MQRRITSFHTKPKKPLKRSYFKRKGTNSQLKPKRGLKRKLEGNKRKSKSMAKLKKDLDAVFSKFIRQKYADDQGNVACYTCGKVKHYKQMQCGHFVSRQYLSTRWDENNCRVQDVGCNVFGNGQLLDFEEKLIKELGREKVEELKQKRHQITKLTIKDYEEKIEYYKSKLEEI